MYKGVFQNHFIKQAVTQAGGFNKKAIPITVHTCKHNV